MIINRKQGYKMETLKWVSLYKYLRSINTEDRRIKHSEVIAPERKQRYVIYSIVILRSILYVNENWVIQKEHVNKVHGIRKKYLRGIAEKTKRVEIPNEIFREMVQLHPIMKKKEKQLGWFGHKITPKRTNKKNTRDVYKEEK